jgi:hypothetical protein
MNPEKDDDDETSVGRPEFWTVGDPPTLNFEDEARSPTVDCDEHGEGMPLMSLQGYAPYDGISGGEQLFDVEIGCARCYAEEMALLVRARQRRYREAHQSSGG